jgi:hypothetical protein
MERKMNMKINMNATWATGPIASSRGKGGMTGGAGHAYLPDHFHGKLINGGSGDDRIEINGPHIFPFQVDGGSGDDVIVIGPGGRTAPEPGPSPENTDPVAANEYGTITGDPHFRGGDGGKFDVQGEPGKVYDLLSDKGLDFRGRFDKWGDQGATVVGETGLTLGENLMKSDHVNFRKDGSAAINGDQMEEGKTYELADGGTAKLKNGVLTVTTGEGYTIKQTVKGRGDKAHIDIEVTTGDNGVNNGRMPGGLLGQTFDADNAARNGKKGAGAQGEGAIDGKVQDYECQALDPINEDRGSDTEDDPIELKPRTYTDAGSGDDIVRILTGGRHEVDLGSGDDNVFVDFEDGDQGNSATIEGGSGDDTVTLAGSRSDYSITKQGGYTVYTDKDGNSVRVAGDVEKVAFEETTPILGERQTA